jgi:hypothetical protein
MNHHFHQVADEYRTVTPFDRRVEFPFVSWQETAAPVVLPAIPALDILFTVQYECDAGAAPRLEAVRQELLAEAQTRDRNFESVVEPSVPRLTRTAHGAGDQAEIDRIRDRWATPCGYAVWGVCLVLGYQPIVEAFAGYETGKHTVFCHTVISLGPGLRARYGDRDEAAAEAAIDISMRTAPDAVAPEVSEPGYQPGNALKHELV